MSYKETVINVENVSKCYHIYNSPSLRLKQFILPPIKKVFGRGSNPYYREFWSVKDVSFKINKGETIGIIGNNGAGKSTILQMICGTLNPSGGRIKVKGRIAALLELGSGFNMDFSGRENVYLNAAVLGLTKNEIDQKYSEIVEFSGIGEFIDQPVKTYSSGMIARLAFSVAIQVEPDILIVDEALSVGDMAFQEKSFTKMKEIRDKGTSILFVSHSLSAVRNFCETAIWLEKGVIRMMGERLDVCDAYQSETEGKSKAVPTRGINETNNSPINDKKLTLKFVTCSKKSYRMGDEIIINFELDFSEPELKYGIGIIIYDSKGTIVTILNTLRDDIIISKPSSSIDLVIPDNRFGPGEYHITASASDELGMFAYDKVEYVTSFRIEMERNSSGLAKVDGILRCEHEWKGI